MIFDFLRFKKRKAEQERIEELEKAKKLWLNYSVHHVLYNIHYKDPLTGKVKIFKFPKKFSREKQRDAYEKDKENTWTQMLMREGQSLLNEKVGYWIGGKSRKGTIIQHPISVDYKEITKAEYDKIQDKA